MHLNQTRAAAGTALMAALSTILLLLGTFIPVNTLFFTAMAAYLIGYTISRYGLKYGAAQLVLCVLLDFFLNPDKVHWGLYLCLGGYIFLCELVFAKWNHIEDQKKKLRFQLVCNWGLFQVIFVPILLFFRSFFPMFDMPAGTFLLWMAGQLGWIVYDKAYRVFISMLRERKL